MAPPKAILCKAPLFQHDILAVPSRKRWERLADQVEDWQPIPGEAGGFTLSTHWRKGGAPVICVWVDAKRHRGSLLVSILAHEASHVARFVLDGIGETTRTHEVEAYLVGEAARFLHSALVAG